MPMTVARSYGQHSNRLIQNVHFEAYCLEHGIRYRNPTFYDIHRYYRQPCKLFHSWIDFICMLIQMFERSRFSSRFRKIINAAYRMIGLDDKDTVCAAPLPRLVHGFKFRLPSIVQKHSYALRDKYTLRNKYAKDLRQLFGIKEGVTIGVHIRGADYQIWRNGKYYYADSVYLRVINKLREEITNDGRAVNFIIFSNRLVDIGGQPDVHISSEPWYVDHHLMSQCDYLVGPPSTFTLWAAWMGGVKYYHLQTARDEVKLEKFGHCINLPKQDIFHDFF